MINRQHDSTNQRILSSRYTLRDSVNEISSHVELTKSQLVMITIIQDIQQISIERMDVVHFGEIVQYLYIEQQVQ